MYRLLPAPSTTLPRAPRVLSLSQRRIRAYSSGSPTANNPPPEEFTKTGEKPQDPSHINGRSYEYSQSGGDEMVAAQQSASFNDTSGDPERMKEVAGRGNVVNPLEFSPANSELSRRVDEIQVEKNEERDETQHTGQGLSRKSKTVKKTKIDFK